MTQEEVLDKLASDIRLRGMSEGTVLAYCTQASFFMNYFNKSADEMGEKEFRIFLEYLNRERNLKPTTFNNYNSALRFLFEVTLEQNLNYKRVPRKRLPSTIPNALTREEIVAFLQVIDDPRYKAIFSITYGSGLRLSEVQKLRIQDVDSTQMRLFIYQAKGQKDRYVPLAHSSLEALRAYYKITRPKHPLGYLFLSRCGDDYLSGAAIHEAFKRYYNQSGIKSYATIHTLRHSYATHLMEDGVNIFFIQRLLGHATLVTTMRYLRIAYTDLMKTKSPLDGIEQKCITTSRQEISNHD